MALFTQMGVGLTLSNTSTAKTNNRFTAENSLLEAISYLVVVSMTHFYVAESEDPEWRQQLKGIPHQDKLLYRLVCAFFGGLPVRARPRWAILNSDDTTEYITKGMQPELSSKVGVVDKASLQSKGTKSTYHMESARRMNGRRVKRHLISNGDGYSRLRFTASLVPNRKCHSMMLISFLGRSTDCALAGTE